MELNETDTELWKKAVKSFGGKTLAIRIVENNVVYFILDFWMN